MGANLRLPQDAFLDGAERRGVPDLDELREPAGVYVQKRERALRAGDFAERARACWGLVARGAEALGWIEDALASDDADAQSDAAGVLAWIGVPDAMLPRLHALRDALPDGEALDAIAQLLPPDTEGFASAGADRLFGGRWDAFTEKTWFLDAPLADVIRGIRAGHDASAVARWSFVPARGSLEELLARLEPWAMPSWKQIAVAMSSGWTALFSQGSDVYLFEVAAKALARRCLSTVFSPHVVRQSEIVSYGACGFTLTDGARTDLDPLRTVRSVRASYQSRWTWDVDGEPQPFEDPRSYTRRKIVERFDLEALNRCCAAVGVSRADPSAYGPEAVVIEADTRSWPHPPHSMTSTEWLAAHR